MSEDRFKLDYRKIVDMYGMCSPRRMVFKKTLNQEQPVRGVLWKRCSENMQQIYMRTPMSKYDLDKVAKQLY